MRNSRPHGPPSTLSSSSGNGLVYGTHRSRGPQLAFTPEGSGSGPTKKKTKLIVILGIALPVLACVIGIAAWAVTTDVLRITPRANGSNYNRFGHQGKTRIDNMQSRSDHDVDVFEFHGITSPRPRTPNTTTKSTKKSTSSTSTTTGATVLVAQTMTSPKASDILSKLISDMPPPKIPKNYIVFSPIPDTEDTGNHRKGRRFDGKVVLHDGDDLVADESMISEDTSQELGPEKLSFGSKRKIPVDGHHSSKHGMRPPSHKKVNQKGKMSRNTRVLPANHNAESPPNFMKRPQRGEQFTAFPTNPKPPLNAISNRNGGITQPRPNMNLPRNNMPNHPPNNENNFQNFDNKNVGHNPPPFRNPAFDGGQPRNLNMNYQPPAFQQNAPSFNSQDTPPQFHHLGPPAFQNKDSFQNSQQKQPPLQDNIHMKDNQRLPPFQSHMGPNPNQHSPVEASPPPMNSNIPPQNTFPSDTSPMGSGGPQYFAPPPQTFHTKVSYDKPPSKFPPPSAPLSTYEKVAQTSVDTASDGAHYHHYHHHHHEPVPSGSDPVGDVNFSDVPRANDADRLGTIGIGVRPSRGITLQIGGGGGGLSGLLPLGTLGIAKSIVSALLPRPQLGLNSKVFLGVEVGRGGGFSIG